MLGVLFFGGKALYLENVTVNNATTGIAYLATGSGALYMNGVRVSQVSGNALYVDAAPGARADVSVSDSMFEQGGGGVRASGGAQISLVNSTISHMSGTAIAA